MQVTLLLGISIVVLSILTYNVYSLRQFFQKIMQDLPPIKSLRDFSKIENELIEVRESLFFQKYANIPFTKFRTVSLSNIIVQAKNYQGDENAKYQNDGDTPNTTYEGKDEILGLANAKITKLGGNKIDASSPKYLFPSSQIPENIAAYETEELNYETRMSSILGLNKLGEACYCPGGRPCNWKPKMFSQFIYNTTLFDLEKIEIYELVGESKKLLSKSNEPEISPSDTYALVTMSDQDKIEAVNAKDELIVIIYWVDKDGNKQKVALKNILEQPQEIDSF